MKDNNFNQSTIKIEDIKAEVDKLAKVSESPENKGLFIMKSANEWINEAKNKPTPKMLFGELWFEGEFCILFASSNLGKSILAVQIANSISKGESMLCFSSEVAQQPVLYFDFELSEKQFQNRYSEDYLNDYQFDSGFRRIQMNPDAEIPSEIDYETFLSQSLEKAIIDAGAKVLIIDNLTYMKNGTETAKEALPLMKSLKALKTKHNLSILALAHTPKRDFSKALTLNDLQGSSMIGNFIDSCFAIGKSATDDLRYIKQLKQRACEHIYHSENVIVCEISKPSNFVQFEFVDYGDEQDYLQTLDKKDKENLIQEAKQLKEEGKSLREIGRILGTSKTNVERWVKN